MDTEILKELLKEVVDGKKTIEKALDVLKDLPFKDLGFAKIDTHRELRMGAPEAIYCEGKTPNQILKIIKEMKPTSNILATRVQKNVIQKIKDIYPEAKIYPDSNLVFIGDFPKETIGKVAIITAGTSDIPVGRECEVTARSMGVEVETVFDVGVSGLHRILSIRETIVDADILVIIAGMEGALPSVVAGLTDVPIIAVPTSIGYGSSFKGITPLLTMLNSCAPGIAVMNIDDGYGAGYFAAATIKKILGRERKGKNL